MVRTIEGNSAAGTDDLGVEDAVLMFYKTVLAFDHLRHQIHIISNVIVDDPNESSKGFTKTPSLKFKRSKLYCARHLKFPRHSK
jgi:anthranilate synthase component 1